MSWPLTARTWSVSSRATSACHWSAADRTSTTAPVVREARKVMIATTPMSALPAIVARGTMGASRRADSIGGGDAPLCSVTELVVDMQATIMQYEATRIEPVHETDVMRR